MGINIQSSLVVGLPYNELAEKFPGLLEALDDDSLVAVAASYDAPLDECVIGFRILRSPECGAIEFAVTVDQFPLAAKFHAITGVTPKLYLTADVW